MNERAKIVGIVHRGSDAVFEAPKITGRSTRRSNRARSPRLAQTRTKRGLSLFAEVPCSRYSISFRFFDFSAGSVPLGPPLARPGTRPSRGESCGEPPSSGRPKRTKRSSVGRPKTLRSRPSALRRPLGLASLGCKKPAAERQSSACPPSSNRCTFPLVVRGSVRTNSISRGCLYAAIVSRQCSLSRSAFGDVPATGTT